MHISREKSRAIPNEEGWISSAQRYGCRIMRVLWIKHEKKLCGWPKIIVNELDDSREHIAETMAEEAHLILPIATFLRTWKDHQGIGCPHSLCPRKQDKRCIFMLSYVEPTEEVLI